MNSLDVTCRFTVASEEPADFTAHILGSIIRDALQRSGPDLAETGITVVVKPSGTVKAHVPALA